MKAYLYKDKALPLEAENIEEPKLKDFGAIVKITGCGLCGSDIVKYKQGLVKPDTVLGHEVVGTIEKIKTNTGFKTGDRIVLGHHVPCYKCVYCKNENYSMCREFKDSNIIPGGFGEYVYVSERHLEDTVQKVPETLSDNESSFTEPAACCLRAVRRAGVKKDDIVLVIGLGSIGLLMGQILKSYGAKVMGCDLIRERIELAVELGFNKAYKYTSDNEISALCRKNFQKEGFDKVFLASGSYKTIPLALNAVRDGGVICVFSSISSAKHGFSNNEIYYRDLTVFGSYSPASSDLKDALKMLEKGTIKTDKLATEYNLSQLNKAIEDTISNKILKAYIKIT